MVLTFCAPFQNGAWELDPQKVWMTPITNSYLFGTHAKMVRWWAEQPEVSDPEFLEEAEKRKRTFWASTGMAVRASKGDDLKPEIFVLRGFKALPRVEFQPL